MDAARARTVHLSFSDQPAEVAPSEWNEGWVLRIGGVEQSHVDLEHPERVAHEYLRRMATVLDTLRPPRAPISVAHLGGGALTLVRYVQATRPGSAQVVVEIERELPSFVMGALPLPPGTELEVRIGDAREELAAMAGAVFDAVVLDVFSGESSPTHLATRAFYAEALPRLAPEGLLLVNVGDDAGQCFVTAQVEELEAASLDAGLPGVRMLTHAGLLDHPADGNYVLLAGGLLAAADVEDRAARWRAGGPHPAAVLDAEDTARFARTHGR